MKIKNLFSLPQEVLDKIESLPDNSVTKSGYDKFGFRKDWLKPTAKALFFLYKHWFRVEVSGIENVPSKGRGVLIANHAGILPFDGAMIGAAMLAEPERPRLVRSIVEKFVPTTPFVSVLFSRIGQITGLTENVEQLLEDDELILIFPEGAKGISKPSFYKYRLQRFTMGFMELAVKFKAPIIPVAVIGSEEQAFTIVNLKGIAKKLGTPYLPITPTFPLLGPLGLLPLPVKYKLFFGEPIDVSKYPLKTLDNPSEIRILVQKVKGQLQEMINEGLK